ncbi:hypothetical protein [Longimicrobium sp.]|uniref:hypothetical protein n=1 Tax=Longimicrobium sp. TaxID=2029185 RepID=UPI002ED8064B
MSGGEYSPAGVCSSCPYRVTCHAARQRVVEQYALPSRFRCVFFHEHVRRAVLRAVRALFGGRSS